jgi:Transmembrane protein of unknown function (DUF3556)
MNTHGRALYTLVHRALAGYNEEEYHVCEGENLCSNGCRVELRRRQHARRMPDRSRCGFAPGDVRVVILDAQPHKHRQEFRLVDAATSEFERGYVDVGDMIVNQPWADDLPVHVHRAV